MKNILKKNRSILKMYIRVKHGLKFFLNLLRLFFSSTKYSKKHILGIYDLKTLPWSAGDPLLFIEKLNTLKIIHNADMIDVCIIYDKENPTGIRKDSKIKMNNAQDYMMDFLPLFNTCPYLGSVFQFNSRKEFNDFLKNNIHKYDIFPSLRQYLDESYNFVGQGIVILKELENFYKKYGYIPYLRIGERYRYWANSFYLHYLPRNTVPIVLSLRQPLSTVKSVRNADPKVWLAFIDKCKVVYDDIVFVVVGTREEIFQGLRERSNVIIARDYGTSIIENLALIKSSYCYLGTASGPTTIALFSDLPYLIFQMPEIEKYGLGEGNSFSFSTDRQKIFSSDISATVELIFSEFKELISRLDKNKWKETNKILA